MRQMVERLHNRRTLRALHTDKMRQAADLLEPLIEPEKHCPVADGDKDVVGHRIAELLIDLIRHALHPVDEEGIVDMRGIVGITKLLLCHLHGLRTSIRHAYNVCAVCSNLLDPLCGDIIGDIDTARNARRRRVRRNRRPGVACRVDDHMVNANMRQLPDETLCAAILE